MEAPCEGAFCMRVQGFLGDLWSGAEISSRTILVGGQGLTHVINRERPATQSRPKQCSQ